jgi:hypothetical protein
MLFFTAFHSCGYGVIAPNALNMGGTPVTTAFVTLVMMGAEIPADLATGFTE